MGEKFYLNFTENGFIDTRPCDEPFGYDAAELNVSQKDRKFARDKIFSKGSVDFEFTKTRKHHLDHLLYFHNRHGFEAKVSLTIESVGETITLDLNYQDAAQNMDLCVGGDFAS